MIPRFKQYQPGKEVTARDLVRAQEAVKAIADEVSFGRRPHLSSEFIDVWTALEIDVENYEQS